jgi:hypothetical protein
LRLAGELVENFGNVINGMLPLMKWYVTAYRNGMLPLYGMVCYCLWKWYVTALCNPGKLPKTICNHFRQPLMEMVCNRLWKWYVTALCNLSKLPKTICNHFRQPLMEMVCNRLSSYLPSYATAYRNGRQPLYAT